MPKMPKKSLNILAIDQASNCGWATSLDVYGVWPLTTKSGESAGMKWLRFEGHLKEIHRIKPIDLIVYERVAGFHKNAIIHAAKMVGILERFATEQGIDYRAYSASEIKKFATGKGNANKVAMIEAAKEKLGYTGDNDNEADALWIYKLALTENSQL